MRVNAARLTPIYFEICSGGDRKLSAARIGDFVDLTQNSSQDDLSLQQAGGSRAPPPLLLRPRESRDLHLVSSRVTITPEAVVTWAHDVFGNAVATAIFQTMTDRLEIDSVSELQLDAVAWPVFSIAASAIVYPFRFPTMNGPTSAL